MLLCTAPDTFFLPGLFLHSSPPLSPFQIPQEIYTLNELVMQQKNPSAASSSSSTTPTFVSNLHPSPTKQQQQQQHQQQQQPATTGAVGHTTIPAHLLPADPTEAASVQRNLVRFLNTCRLDNEWDLYLKESKVKL